MKAWILVNLINFLLSLSVTIFYVYPKSDSLFICLFFFMGLVYFNKLLIEQILKQYGKSVK
jgi:hypothetical protein